jgi:hypothetical protein
MVSTRTRPIPLFLTALVAFFSALAALAASNGAAHAHGTAPHAEHGSLAIAVTHNAELSKKAVALRQDLRKLWEDHITWTRLAIISLESGTPDTEATVARLLRNQVDLGNAFKPFYGKAAGAKVTQLLREHILIAADVIAAAKAGDTAKLTDAQARWVANADEIAGFLAGANPRAWPLDEVKDMLHEHLELTANEALARLHGDWDADVAAYDAIHLQALGMADMLATGIVEQFPRRFR